MKAINTLFAIKIIVVLLLFVSCDGLFNNNNDSDELDLGDSLDPIEEVILIEGADNATLTVNINRNENSYFSIGLDNVKSNEIIDNRVFDAWCIDVWKSIDSNNRSYQNIELYSTHLVEKWMPVNYLLNIQQELQNQDSELTWREIQMSIWSLRKYPEFDLDTMTLEELPGQFRKDGEPTFDIEKVREILDIVEANYRDFDYEEEGTKFAVAAKMPVDVQTVIMTVENK